MKSSNEGTYEVGVGVYGFEADFEFGERKVPSELRTGVWAKENVVVVFGVVAHRTEIVILMAPLQ